MTRCAAKPPRWTLNIKWLSFILGKGDGLRDTPAILREAVDWEREIFYNFPDLIVALLILLYAAQWKWNLTQIMTNDSLDRISQQFSQVLKSRHKNTLDSAEEDDYHDD